MPPNAFFDPLQCPIQIAPNFYWPRRGWKPRKETRARPNFFIRYTDLVPEDSRGFAYFGRFFLDQRDYQKADALSAAALDRNSDDPAALALRGQILLMKGQSQDGKTLLRKHVSSIRMIQRRNSNSAQSTIAQTTRGRGEVFPQGSDAESA